MKTFLLNYQSSEIAVHQFGTGDELLIAFHGFADSGQIFGELTALFQQFTIFAIDLPFHGTTKWNAKDYSPTDLLKIIQILPIQKEKFSLMGYSMGGRMCLKLLEHIPNKINQIFLLAPDGLHLPFGHRLILSLPLKMKYWLIDKMQYASFYIRFSQTLYRIGIINQAQMKFIKWNLGNPDRHQRLLSTWLALIHFQYQLSDIKNIIKQYEIPTTVFLGKKDKIIPPHSADDFQEDNPTVTVCFLDTGHRIVGKLLNYALATF